MRNNWKNIVQTFRSLFFTHNTCVDVFGRGNMNQIKLLLHSVLFAILFFFTI